MNSSALSTQSAQFSSSRAKLSSRAYVIMVLEKIQHGESLASLLEPLLGQVAEKDKGFAHELLLGTLRQWWALSRIGESLIEQQVTDKGVWAGLNIGLYQLLYMDTPDYAAIGETVEAIKQLNKGYGAGLINAILRKVQKNPAKFSKKIEKNHSLPNWLAKQLKQDWGEYYDALGQSLRIPAPIFLRVNTAFTTVENYAKLLAEQGIDFEQVPLGLNLLESGDSQTIRLTQSVKIPELPKFADGWVSVQDVHAQIAGHLVKDVSPDQPLSILDACAAPGGKSAHLLELANNQNAKKFHVKQLTALDNDPKRLARVKDTLERLHLSDDKVDLVVADAALFTAKQPFDVILLDAPCTATGVIRRHPDIALLRQETDVAQTVVLQTKILANCWRHLAQGGYLLYVTCSLLKAENEQQIAAFLASHQDANVVDFKLNLPHQLKRTLDNQFLGYQCLPLDPNGGDGFFYALLQKSG